MIVNHYDPMGTEYGVHRHIQPQNVDLGRATSDLVTQIRQTNPYLRVASGAHREQVGGEAALSTVLSGTSPVTGEEERVSVLTRQTGDGHVIYALMIAPGREYGTMNPAFSRMVQTLRVNDEAAHR